MTIRFVSCNVCRMRPSASPIKSFRTRIDASLEELAERFDVNRSTIWRWENGRVPIERVHDVERVTGISRHVLRPDIFGEPSKGDS